MLTATDNSVMQITSLGFQFLLHSPHAQLWELLLQYLHMAEVKIHVNFDSFLSLIVKVGTSYGPNRSSGFLVYALNHGAWSGQLTQSPKFCLRIDPSELRPIRLRTWERHRRLCQKTSGTMVSSGRERFVEHLLYAQLRYNNNFTSQCALLGHFTEVLSDPTSNNTNFISSSTANSGQYQWRCTGPRLHHP